LVQPQVDPNRTRPPTAMVGTQTKQIAAPLPTHDGSWLGAVTPLRNGLNLTGNLTLP
jgi:hypothetical protein